VKPAAIIAVFAIFLAGCADSRNRTSSTSTISQPPAIRVSGGPGEIPAGTTLDVRTNESINSKDAVEGKTYQAEISTEVVGANGQVLIPKGSQAELVVLELRDKSGIKGPGIQLGLQSVTVNGTRYLAVTREVERTSGIGKNQRTAEMVGGGAALGTVIGAAAGGGKGAVIGGLVGAAAGAAAQVITQGEEVRIPAETVMNFRLNETMRLQPTN
jgi:outer membrane lipoprotein SlyB